VVGDDRQQLRDRSVVLSQLVERECEEHADGVGLGKRASSAEQDLE
jgi:hypothetical protein